MGSPGRDEREYQPDFDADDQAQRFAPRTKIARQLALALLKQSRITTPEVDVESLAVACGLEVAYVEVDSALSGQLYPDLREVTINRKSRSRERQRFTLAHELGHWQLRHHVEAQLPEDLLGYSGVFEGDSTSEGLSRIEVEANTFAAELLIPSPWIRKVPKPLRSGQAQQLAARYGVSEQAMFYQLMRCGRL
jgi:Zn-dependent peptidase ImmA (M78 family)